MLAGIAVFINKYSIKDRIVASYERVQQMESDVFFDEKNNQADHEEKQIVISEASSEVDEPVYGETEIIQEDFGSNITVPEDLDMIEEKIRSMTLHEKVCQMIVAWPEQVSNISKTQTDEEGMLEGLKKYPVGGIIYFGDNLVDPSQTKNMIANTQKISIETSGIPLFICVDEEGGNTLRIASNPSFGLKPTPAMETMSSKKEVKNAAREIGRYLKELGFNFDFAPDADVITNPLNQIIASRSFGTDPKRVSKFSKAYSDGLHEEGILSSYKHFPGHGSTEGDTHEGFAYTNRSLDELMQSELIPFKDAMKAGADSVMVAHISVPNVIGDNTPCTLSEKMITDILRNQFGFEGLIVTDALNMKAITKNYTPKDAAVMTVKAGADIVLMPLELETAIEAIKAAVLNGEIAEERIDASVRRILEKKKGLEW